MSIQHGSYVGQSGSGLRPPGSGLPPPGSELPGLGLGYPGAAGARPLTEPLRELCCWALLAANAVFLLLGVSDLLLVVDGWGQNFGPRCAQVFETFAGPLALGLPVAALLLATHVVPMVRRSRALMLVILSELGVSAGFGVVTFLGAFASDLTSVRATMHGLLWRGVWLGLLVLTCVLAARVWLGLYPAPRPPAYRTYTAPAATYASPVRQFHPAQGEPTVDIGLPSVPPPPMPEPLPGPEATRTAATTAELPNVADGSARKLADVADEPTQQVGR